MIKDSLKNSKFYYGLNQNIDIGLKYLEETDFSLIDPGKYEIDGRDIFATVSVYETKTQGNAKIENHKKYIDIQYIVSGEECIGYAAFVGQIPVIDYDEEKDVAFYQCETSLIKFKKGDFSIFFPHDIHSPGIVLNRSSEVKKVVVKVKVD